MDPMEGEEVGRWGAARTVGVDAVLQGSAGQLQPSHPRAQDLDPRGAAAALLVRWTPHSSHSLRSIKEK